MKRISPVALGRHLFVIAGLALASTVGNLSAADTYYVSDHLATTTAVTDAAGEIASLEADAFGSPVSGGEQAARYTGKPYDADIGAYVFPFRNYRSDEARWMSADPSGFPDGINNKWYAANPNSEFDPLGLKIVTGTHTGSYNMLEDQLEHAQQSFTATYSDTYSSTNTKGGTISLGYKVAKVDVSASIGVTEGNIASWSSSLTGAWTKIGLPATNQTPSSGKTPTQTSASDVSSTFISWSGGPTIDPPSITSPKIVPTTAYERHILQTKIYNWSREYTYNDGKE
jgi:RHS repeat-associated protein